MNPWKYTLVFAIPLVTACGLLLGGPALAATPLVVFGFVPLLELVLPGTASNLSSDEEADARQDWRYDAVLYATAPIQLGLIGLFLLKVAAGEFQGLEWLLATVSVGINCGGLGINIGHELGHRSSRQEQRLAKLLLGTSLYAHFFIEHNRGHHSRVATRQ